MRLASYSLRASKSLSLLGLSPETMVRAAGPPQSARIGTSARGVPALTPALLEFLPNDLDLRSLRREVTPMTNPHFRPWTEEDNTTLKSLAGKMPTARIAAELGRSPGATVVQLQS